MTLHERLKELPRFFGVFFDIVGVSIERDPAYHFDASKFADPPTQRQSRYVTAMPLSQ
jgi:hypothetical protein